MEVSPHSIWNWIISAFSSVAIGAAILTYIPPSAALVALIWYVIQIYESATVQRWIAKRRVRRLARLKAAVLMLEAKQLPMPPGMGD